MKLYLTHSSGFDYQTELYEPLKRSLAKTQDIFFPHDEENIGTKSKDIIAKSNFVLAEVSYPSTGQGIELGWANDEEIPIVCFYRSGHLSSGSLRFISDTFIEYTSTEDMTEKLIKWFDEHETSRR